MMATVPPWDRKSFTATFRVESADPAEGLTCMLCGGPRCQWMTKLGGEGRRIWVGLHESCISRVEGPPAPTPPTYDRIPGHPAPSPLPTTGLATAGAAQQKGDVWEHDGVRFTLDRYDDGWDGPRGWHCLPGWLGFLCFPPDGNAVLVSRKTAAPSDTDSRGGTK